MRNNRLTACDAAKVLGVCKTAIINWHKNGKLIPYEVHPITKIRYYRMEDLEKFLKEQSKKKHPLCRH